MITKEEQIRVLVKQQKIVKEQLKDTYILLAKLRKQYTDMAKKINWLSHLIRKGE